MHSAIVRVFRPCLNALLPILLAVTAPCAAQGVPSFPFILRPLGAPVNSASDDYAPVAGYDGSLYCTTTNDSVRPADVGIVRFVKDRSGAWASAPAPISRDMTGCGTMCLIPDAHGSKRAIIASDDESLAHRTGDTDLFLADIASDGSLHIVFAVDSVNSPYWDSHPTVAEDGTLYFASDRPGGYGGTDIWIARLRGDGRWDVPVPASGTINTSGNERAPFISPDGGTLIWTTDGRDGYGGYDLWMSTMENGNWGQPVNLGPIINSAGDDLFLSASAEDSVFHFSSNRTGGEGGLDIIEAAPNLFGNGMFRLTVSVLDSLSSKPLPSSVVIRDDATGKPLYTFQTNSVIAEYSQLLPARRRYHVEATVQGYPQKSLAVRPLDPGTKARAVLHFGPVTIAEFDLGRYNIPFFVTGYYRPNTKHNLDELPNMLAGPLAEAQYIERFKRYSDQWNRYSTYAETVDGIFKTVYDAAVNTILPQFAAHAGQHEVLEIRVIGYADPQPLVGTYLEDQKVAFLDSAGEMHTVKRGSPMDNVILSGLRAWYSGAHLDRMLSDAAQSGKREYTDLKNAGRIRYVYVGAGVSNDSADYAVQRRIRITIARAGEGDASKVYDSNTRPSD